MNLPNAFEIWNEPKIPVSMAGPAGSDISYVENLLLKLGGDLYSDSAAIHPYGLNPEYFPSQRRIRLCK